MQGGGDRYAKGIPSESRGTKQVQGLGVQGGVLGRVSRGTREQRGRTSWVTEGCRAGCPRSPKGPRWVQCPGYPES